MIQIYATFVHISEKDRSYPKKVVQGGDEKQPAGNHKN
jgi:hypothetical protein